MSKFLLLSDNEIVVDPRYNDISRFGMEENNHWILWLPNSFKKRDDEYITSLRGFKPAVDVFDRDIRDEKLGSFFALMTRDKVDLLGLFFTIRMRIGNQDSRLIKVIVTDTWVKGMSNIAQLEMMA